MTSSKNPVGPAAVAAADSGTAQHRTAAGDGRDGRDAPHASGNQVAAMLDAKNLGIRLGVWSFDAQGNLDTSGLVCSAEGDASSGRLPVRAGLQADATDDQLAPSRPGLAARIRFLIGLGYLAYLLRRHPERIRDMGMAFE